MDESVTSPGEAERWLPVVGYEGLYEVSDRGRVRSLDRVVMVATRWGGVCEKRIRGYMLKPCYSVRYWCVGLHCDGVTCRRRIHVLVARAFLGPRPEGYQVCHGPAGPLVNTLANLSYGTLSKNYGADKYRDGTMPVGSGHVGARLTEAIVREIRDRSAAGESQSSLAREYGVSRPTITRAARRENWKHVA